MKIAEIVDIIRQLERKEELSYDQLKALGIWDEDQGLYERETGNEYKGVMIPRNAYAPKEITLLNAWAKLLGEDNFVASPFCERTFLRTFLKDIPKEQQWDYIKNTNLYYGKTPELADPNFVLVTRRSLPTTQEKPEVFWATEPHTTFWGLKYEISAEHRAYSAILVSTLGAIKEYGEQDFESISGGASDGEIITSCKPFPRENVLFAYKPLSEWSTLVEAAENPENSYDNFVARVFEANADRYKPLTQTPGETVAPEPDYPPISQVDSEFSCDFSLDEW